MNNYFLKTAYSVLKKEEGETLLLAAGATISKLFVLGFITPGNSCVRIQGKSNDRTVIISYRPVRNSVSHFWLELI